MYRQNYFSNLILLLPIQLLNYFQLITKIILSNLMLVLTIFKSLYILSFFLPI